MDEKNLTAERGAVYGHPLDDFGRVEQMKDALRQCPDAEVRHAMEMICVKLARLVHTPDHQDTIDDIKGYAECINMIHAERRKREHVDPPLGVFTPPEPEDFYKVSRDTAEEPGEDGTTQAERIEEEESKPTCFAIKRPDQVNWYKCHPCDLGWHKDSPVLCPKDRKRHF